MENCNNHTDKKGPNICRKCWGHFCDSCFDSTNQTCLNCNKKIETSKISGSEIKIPNIFYLVVSILIIIVFFYVILEPFNKKTNPAAPKHKKILQNLSTNGFNSTSNGITVNAESKATADKLLKKTKYYLKVLPGKIGIPKHKPMSKLYVKVFSDKNSYTEETGKPLWSEGYVDSNKRRIYIVADYEDNSVLAHEVSHLIFESYMKYENPFIVWIDEGLAVNQQMQVDSSLKENIREHIENIKKGYYWKIDQLGGVDLSYKYENDIDTWYAQCASIVFYLQKKYGFKKFKLFLSELQKKGQFETALKKTYGINQNQLQNNWLNNLKNSSKYF